MALSNWMKVAASYPLLSVAEEYTLAHQAWKGNTAAQDRLVEHNLRLVIHVAKKFGVYHFEENVSVGNIGLIEASRTFDPTRGVRFASYAAVCIQNMIMKDGPMGKIQNFKCRQGQFRMSSLENIIIDDTGHPFRLQDILESDDPTPEEIMIEQDYNKKLRKWIDLLDRRGRGYRKDRLLGQSAILKRCFGIDCDEETMEGIAENDKSTRQNVFTRRKHALKRLKKIITHRGGHL